MGGGSIQVLGFKRRRLSHKKKREGGGMCPQVLLFLDMDRSAMSWAVGRAGGSVWSEKGRGLSPGHSTTMRKVRIFNLQAVKGQRPGERRCAAVYSFCQRLCGTRQGVAAAEAFGVREDLVFSPIILQELSIKSDENSNCAAAGG